jgi:hypothetical protein
MEASGTTSASPLTAHAAHRCLHAVLVNTTRLGVALTFGLVATAAAGANDALPDLGTSWRTRQDDNDAVLRASPNSKPNSAFAAESDKSYVIPALEVVGFAFLLNQVNRHTDGSNYDSNWSTIQRNLHSSWVVDSDPFQTNQLGHPYQGSMFFGFARSAGLNYWESLGYSFGGSTVWEIAGEATPPSRNDLLTTGLGGSLRRGRDHAQHQ